MFGWGLADYLPEALRPALISLSNFLRDRRFKPTIPVRRKRRTRPCKRTVVAGLLRMRTGITRGAELMFLDLQSKGVNVTAVDLTDWLQYRGEREYPDAQAPADLGDASFDIVVHLNPPAFTHALSAFDAKTLNRSRIIGYWVWELEKVPENWLQSAEYCDEVWVPTPFVADAVRATLGPATPPMKCIPYAVDTAPFTPATHEARRKARADLALAETDFVAGFSFSMGSNYTRKNPMAVVGAFQRAFPDDRDVRLIIRCNDDPRQFPRGWNELSDAAASDQRLILLRHANIGMPALYAAIDTYVSLHRSEGYGLTLVEALQAGRPVIATGWGMAPDIAARPHLTQVGYRLVEIDDPQGAYSSMKDCRWAEPDIEKAAAALRGIRSNLKAGVQAMPRQPIG